MLYIAADHRGYKLKEKLKKYLSKEGYKFQDVGAFKYNANDDYPDFGKEVSKRVSQNSGKDKGILICGSGIGMDILANKFKNVRSALVFSAKAAKMSREHNNANILNLAADFLPEKTAKEVVKTWLEAKFSGEKRHVRRLKKIEEAEIIN